MTRSDQNIVSLITGAASGIGKATSLRLAGPGRALVLTTRSNETGLKQVADAARAKGSEVVICLVDLTEPNSTERMVKVGREAFGSIDQIVSNAGFAQRSNVTELLEEDLQRAIDLNTRPFLSLVQAAKNDLLASSCGRVVAVSSFVSQLFGVNDTLFSATAASKSALVALARSLAFELAPKGVTVNCVSPGFTEKDVKDGALDKDAWQRAAATTPNGRLGTPEDIAAAIAFFLSPDAHHITGQVLNVDGGLTLR